MKAKQPLVISYLRFSTPEQAQGDSVRRQIEASEKWAKSRGWTIDDRLKDEGVSAYRGANAATGALGRIVANIQNGTIPAGSYLVIENFDRLSRSELLEAIQLLLSVINAGVVLVTLNDGREYSKVTYDLTNLIISASQLARSNEESRRKAELVGAAWREKKSTDARNGTPITARVPAWLKLQGDRIVPVAERVVIVGEIFALAVKGYGRNWITRHLNNKYKHSFNPDKFWSNTYVLNILRNRAVIGEYQPHRLTYADGRKLRQPEGEPIPHYYPAVVNEKTFYAAQNGLEQRRRTGGPLNGVTINVWQGLLHDMDGFRLISKTSKEWRRYYISSQRDGRGKGRCIAFPADQFDFALLTYLSELIPREQPQDHRADLKEIEGRIGFIDGKLRELSDAIERRPLQTLITKIERLENEKAELERGRYGLIGLQAQRQSGTINDAVPLAQLQRILKVELTAEERMRLRESIRSSVGRVDAHFAKPADEGEACSQRDYIASTRIVLKGGSEHFFAFRLHYLDYRKAGHNKSNPYRIQLQVEGQEALVASFG